MQPDPPQLSAHLPPQSAHSRVLAACARPSCPRKLPPQGTLCSFTCLRSLATTSCQRPHCIARSGLHNDNNTYLASCHELHINCLSSGSVSQPFSLSTSLAFTLRCTPKPTKQSLARHALQTLCTLTDTHSPCKHAKALTVPCWVCQQACIDSSQASHESCLVAW